MKYHKTNGPVKANWIGGWVWCLNDKYHRYYGPAFEDGDWALRGKIVRR